MKAIRIHSHGDPEVLTVDDLDVPKAPAEHALVRIKATAMNHMDLWVRKGLPGVKIPLPIILGCEGAGIIEEVGSPLKNFKKGDEVILNPSTSCGICEMCLAGNDHYCRDYKIYGEHQDGTEVEYKIVPEHNLLPKPKNLSFEESASIPLAFLTAWQMLVDRGQVTGGQTVLILAAGSGVSSAGVQIAKLFGTQVIATIGSDDKIEKVKALGADFVINHRTQDIAEEVKKITNKRGCDIIFEHVGAAVWEKCLRSLAFRGKLVTCGATTGYDVKLDLRHIFIKQQQILGSTMGPKASLFKILRLMEEKKLHPVVDQSFPFSEIVAAHHRLEDREQFGKIVLVPD